MGADGNLCISDLTTGTRIRRIKAHKGVINSLDRIATGGTELLVTGGDDGAVRVWDVGADGQGEDAREPVKEFEVGCPVTAVCWSSDAAQIYVAALDNCIHVRFLSCRIACRQGSRLEKDTEQLLFFLCLCRLMIFARRNACIPSKAIPIPQRPLSYPPAQETTSYLHHSPLRP